MKVIRINTAKPYQVLVGENLLNEVGDMMLSLCQEYTNDYQKIAVISDDNVMPLYGKEITHSLAKKGFPVFSYSFPAGEASKTMATTLGIIDWLVSHEFTRTDFLVALGGGVVGDIVGFASSIYLRGCDYIQIPTSFLAAVDSSVGGKTAVNLSQGKNLVGSFWQPSLVLCDTLTFKTLTEEVFADGIAEALKYGCLWDISLFESLETTAWQNNNICDIVARCVAIKAEIVAEDERDAGVRQLLNFGHTFGHGIEKLSHYTISHGHAVAIGMCVVIRSQEKQGSIPIGTSARIENALTQYGLPTSTDYSAIAIAKAVFSDKKRAGDVINLILLESLGKATIVPTPIAELSKFIQGGL